MTARSHALSEYALLADSQRGALVGPHGDVVWLCVPRWDSPSVFSTLLGGQGVYAITPRNERYFWGGHYEDGTLIWRHRWITDTGALQCRDALAAPGSGHTTIVVRRVIAESGDARVGIRLAPRGEYDAVGAHQLGYDDGVWHGRCGQLYWGWSGAAELTPRSDSELHGELTVPAGQSRDLLFEISTRPFRDAPPIPARVWRATEAHWHETVGRVPGSIAPRDARHALALLHGLTDPAGGMVAAATTSLPERARTGRNYDYRYAWLRDQAYTGLAAAVAGEHTLLDTAVGFIAERILDDGPRTRPVYTVTGQPVPTESALPLPGYPGGGCWRGNRAGEQFQLDVFGEALLLFAAAAREERLDDRGWSAVNTAVEAIRTRWSDTEAGIWELENRRWTHSRLSCVAGLRSVAALPQARGGSAHDWQRLADRMLADTSAVGLHPKGYWQRASDDTRLDSALLLPPIRGALPAHDSRTRATLEAVRERLSVDGFVYRFRQDDRPLGDAEGAFLLCGFVMALAEHQQHRPVSAAHWFERGRGACGVPGIFSEEYDVGQREPRGNLPQAFVHALLLETSVILTGSG